MKYMELPETCLCGYFYMVDWDNLERRPLSKLMWMEGRECPSCKRWKPFVYMNLQLESNFRRLNSMLPTHPSFKYHLSKAVKRAEEIQRRGMDAYGSIRHTNMATAR